MANETFAQQLAGYNPTVAESKASNLQERKYEKLNRLSPAQANESTAAELQQQLSDAADAQIYTRDDGSKYQLDYMIDPSTGLSQGTREVEFTDINKYGTTDSRNLYIDDTAEGNYKLGLARSDKGFDGRYTPGSTGYGWAPGERGVTPEDGALLDIELPYNQATQLEYDVHSNKGQILNRVAGQSIEDVQAARSEFGSGVSEYTTPDAPMWNIEYQAPEGRLGEDTYTPEKPAQIQKSERQEKLRELQRQSDGYIGDVVDAAQSSMVKWWSGTAVPGVKASLKGIATTLGMEKSTADKLLKEYASESGLFGDSFENLAKQEVADAYTGVSKKTRGEFNTSQKVALEAIKDERYGDATLSVLGNLPMYIADSAGETVSLATLPTALLTLAGRTTKQAEEYRENNDGKDPSTEWYLGSLSADAALMFGERLIIGKGLKDALSKGSSISRRAKGTGAAIATEIPQEMGESTKEEYFTQAGAFTDEADQELLDILGSPETKLAGLSAGLSAGGISVAGNVGSAVASIPEEVGKSAARGAKVRQAKAQAKQSEEAVGSRIESIKEAGLKYGADVRTVESESEIIVDSEGNNVIRFDKPQNIRATSKSAEEYESNLEKAKQDVINSTYTIKGGKVSGLNTDELRGMSPDQVQDRVDKVNRWMTDYKDEFTGKDGSILQNVQDTYTEITSSGTLRAAEFIETAREDSVLTEEQKTKASSPEAAEAIKGALKEDVTPEQYTALSNMEPKTREGAIASRLKTLFSDTEDGKEGKYKIAGKEVPVEYIRRLARETSKSYDISGINFQGVGAEPSFETMARVGKDEAAIKGANPKDKSEKAGIKAVDNLSITGDVLYTIMEGSLTEETVKTLNVKSTNKLDQRVIKPLNDALGHKVGNRAKLMKDTLGKFNEAIKQVDDKRVAQVFKKGTDPQGSMLKLMVATMNAVNAATASDTEGRQGITSPNNENVDNSIARDEFYAAQSNVITQAGKDFVSMFGIQLTGKPEQILKQHRELGKLGVELLASQGIIEQSKNPVVFKVGDNTVDAGNMKISSSKGAKDGFKWARLHDVSGDRDVVGYEDTGIRLSDTTPMVTEGNTDFRGTYESETGDMVKRLSKILLPVSSYAPTAEPITGAIKTDPEVVLYANEDPTKDIRTTIQRYRETKFKLSGKFKDRLKAIKEIRDEKYDGSLVQAARKEAWISSLLGLEKSDSLILQDSDSGSNGGKLDSINGILDNLDDLDGEFHYDYQVDLNNRITVLNNILNYQHDNVFSRHVVVGEEYTVDEGTKQERLLLNGVLEDMGMKFKTKEEWAEARGMLKDPSKATGKIKTMQTISNAFRSGDRSEISKMQIAVKGMKKTGFGKGSFKFMRVMDAVNDIRDGADGSISTDFMVEMDARASGVTNTTLNIAGRNPELFKELLKTIGIKLEGDEYNPKDIEDAYEKLQTKVVDELDMDVLEEADGETLDLGDVDGVGSIINKLGDLGIDTRDLAKGPVMTWFYSAGESTITKDLTDNLIKQVVGKAANGDSKAIAHLREVLKNDNITPTYVKNMSVRGKDTKVLREAYNGIGNLYFTHLDAAFPEVNNYKKEMNDIFAQITANSKVGGIDFFQGVVRSASQALYDDGKPMEWKGLTTEGNVKRQNGSTSIFKSKDVALTGAQKTAAGLGKDLADSSMLSTTRKMENQASIMALLAQSSDFAIIEPSIQKMMDVNESGFLSVHDALYGSPAQLLEAKEVYEQTTLDVAKKNDFVETLIQSAEMSAKGIEVAIKDGFFKGNDLVDAKSNLKKLQELVNSKREVNNPRVEAKQEMLEGAESHVFGEQDADMVEGTEVETVQPKKTKKPTPKKEEKPAVKEEPKEKTTMEKFIESKDVNALLSDIANENDLLKGKVERIQEDAVPIIIFDEAAKKELYKTIDSVSDMNKEDKASAKADLDNRLKNGSSFSVNGKAYIGRSTAEGRNEFNGSKGTVESVLDTIGHEVEHGVTDYYLSTDEAKQSREYKVLTKVVQRLRSTNKDWRSIRLGSAAGKRLEYIINQPTTEKSIKELLAVYQAEDGVVDGVVSAMEDVLDIKRTFIERAVQGVRKAVHAIINGKSYSEISKMLTDNIDTRNIILSAEAVSMRAREKRKNPSRSDIDSVGINDLYNKYLKDCKI